MFHAFDVEENKKKFNLIDHNSWNKYNICNPLEYTSVHRIKSDIFILKQFQSNDERNNERQYDFLLMSVDIQFHIFIKITFIVFL